MALKSTHERYGAVALTLHWTCAALILALIPMGFIMQSAPEPLRVALYQAHAAVGALVGVVTLIRLAWWFGFDRKPLPPGEHSRLQSRLAKGVHAGFYVVVLALTVSGIGMAAASSLGAMLVSGDPSLLPADLMRLPPRSGHGLMARLLMALLALHVLGALYHHWAKRDGTLERMLPVSAPRPSSARPLRRRPTGP